MVWRNGRVGIGGAASCVAKAVLLLSFPIMLPAFKSTPIPEYMFLGLFASSRDFSITLRYHFSTCISDENTS